MNKPLCENCPVLKNDKTIIYCGCKKELQAIRGNKEALKKMNINCPLDWSQNSQNSTENK